MSKPVSWSFSAGSAAASVGSFGKIDAESVTGASAAVGPASHQDLALQFEHIEQLGFVYIGTDRYDGKTKVKASGANATEIALSGPLILFGSAIGLLGDSLVTLTVTNDDAGQTSNLEIMIGGQLS